MRCRHSTTRRMWRLGESWCGWVAAVRAGRSWDEFGARICNHCGSWLPLGESNDEPEAVRVEIRAAEIAHRDADRCDWNLDELHGWTDFAIGDEVGCCPCSSPDAARHTVHNWHAGYLAREIATHSEES